MRNFIPMITCIISTIPPMITYILKEKSYLKDNIETIDAYIYSLNDSLDRSKLPINEHVEQHRLFEDYYYDAKQNYIASGDAEYKAEKQAIVAMGNPGSLGSQYGYEFLANPFVIIWFFLLGLLVLSIELFLSYPSSFCNICTIFLGIYAPSDRLNTLVDIWTHFLFAMAVLTRSFQVWRRTGYLHVLQNSGHAINRQPNFLYRLQSHFEFSDFVISAFFLWLIHTLVIQLAVNLHFVTGFAIRYKYYKAATSDEPFLLLTFYFFVFIGAYISTLLVSYAFKTPVMFRLLIYVSLRLSYLRYSFQRVLLIR